MKLMSADIHSGENPTGMWMSEKYDGVRAVWDGANLVSKEGNVFKTPQWFTEAFPKERIEGELWEGRGLFQSSTVGKVRSGKGDWSDMKFMIFDNINQDVFEKRIDQVKSLSLPDHCRIIEQVICTGRDHLKTFENEVLEKNGEAVMLRKAKSLYEGKKSRNILKVLKFISDEAVVVDYTPGKGRNIGKIGALVCEYAGKVFKIGSGLSDKLRLSPPSVGSIVTFSYCQTTLAGIPKRASFSAVRDYE